MYSYEHGGNAPYEHGGENILDLSANINPLGFPPKAGDAIINSIKFCDRYPDSSSKRLIEKISEFEHVSPDWIFCGNGASDIIFRLPPAVKPKNAMLLAPTFADYERALTSYGADIRYHFLDERGGFAVDEKILEAAQSDLVFICNPNNPTGVLTKPDIIEELLKRHKFVVVDECFIDFTENAGEYSVKPLLGKYGNLIILKAFTKVFGLPGIRLGYAMCGNPDLINALHFHGADWAVSALAQAAGIAALENSESYLQETVAYVSAERDYIINELKALGFKTYKSSANYVFFRSTFEFDLSGELNRRGVRIRQCANFKGLGAEYFRVGVSQRQNNRRLINEISLIRGNL